jgi:predicted Rdx family selenoprotein
MDRFSSACVDMLLWERAEEGGFYDGRYLVDGEQVSPGAIHDEVGSSTERSVITSSIKSAISCHVSA